MPLSEEELRLLEQMEKALVAEDPKLASTMRGTTVRRHARRRALVAAGVFVVGVVVLMTGAVTQVTVVGIVGFVLMLGGAYVGLVSWRGLGAVTDEEPAADEHAPFTLIDGGRAGRRGARPRAAQHHSLMERFEERWRRRRDQNGF